LIEQDRELYARPFGARYEPVQLLNIALHRLLRVQRRAVAAAFNECLARLHRIARERIHCEDERALDHAVDQQAMAVRVDIGHPVVAALEMQSVWGDHAIEPVVRRARGSSTRRGGGGGYSHQPWLTGAAGLVIMRTTLASWREGWP